MALPEIVNTILHVDKVLEHLVHDYGSTTYALLFLIVFCETGLVVTPFLPGDSLLFAAGAFAARPGAALDIVTLAILFPAAALIGDNLNYAVGKFLGPTLHAKGKLPFVKQAHLDKTHAFYEKYGPRALVLARFVPIVRTFAPFVAGIGKMTYSRFIGFSVVGALAWSGICLGAGFFFGNMPIVQKNFQLVVMAIIAVSLLPMVITVMRERSKASKEAKAAAAVG